MEKNHMEGTSRKKNTLWNFLFLNVRFVITLINGLLIIPIYLHYIDVSLYGAWLATGNVLTWITIIDPGVGDVLLQKVAYAIGKKDKAEIGKAITSGLLISSCLLALSLLLGYTLSFYICDIAKINDGFRPDIEHSFRIALWGTAFALFADTFSNIIVAFQKTKIHGLFINIVLSLSILVNLAMLFGGMGIYALAYTNFFRGASTLAYSLIFAFVLIRKNSIRLHCDWGYFKTFSRVFSYTFFSRLFETVASNIDLIIVSRYLGSGYVTILDICRRPIKIVSGLANNVTISMLPTLAHLFGTGDESKIRSIVVRIWSVVLWMSCLVVGGFILFNHSLVSLWVGPSLWIGNGNNVILCISFFLLSVGYNLSNITYSMGDIKNNSLINVVRSSVYLVCLFFFSKTMGISGVLLSFVAATAILFFYYPKRVITQALFKPENKTYMLRETAVCLIVLGLVSSISLYFRPEFSMFYLVVFASVYLVSYAAALLFFSNGFKTETKNLQQAIYRKIRPPKLLETSVN